MFLTNRSLFTFSIGTLFSFTSYYFPLQAWGSFNIRSNLSKKEIYWKRTGIFFINGVRIGIRTVLNFFLHLHIFNVQDCFHNWGKKRREKMAIYLRWANWFNKENHLFDSHSHTLSTKEKKGNAPKKKTAWLIVN